MKNRKRTKASLFLSLLRFPFMFIGQVLAFVGKPVYYALAFSFLYIFVFLGIAIPYSLSYRWKKFGTLFKPQRKKRQQGLRVLTQPVYLPSEMFRALTRATPRLFYLSLGTIFFLTTTATFFYFYVLKDLPSPQDLITRKQVVSTKIFDRHGVPLYTIYKDKNRTIVPLSEVPISLKQATIAIEDKDFYSHSGFSITGIIRALKANIQKKKVEGGSTITQQLIKNTLLSPERTLQRKLKELVLAIMVESTVSKDDILAMYLNEVSYGGSVYGVEEASQRYFGKSVRNLTLAESTYLAGLPQAPSVYSPFGPNPDLGFVRQQQVLQRMVEDKYLTVEEAAKAAEEKLNFRSDINDIKAPHFVMYIRDLLAKQYGEELVSQGGLEVITTLDYEVQQYAEKAIQQEMEKVQRFHITNGAALVTNPKTGAILAMVGSRNYFDVKHDGQVNVTLRPRQPGSSIKPLTYATAFEKGFTPATILDDSPITYKVLGAPSYSPQNYDGKFHGKVPLRIALASSYNIPAVKTLATVGVSTTVEKGRQMGITTWDKESASRFGLSLTLGGGEVKMIDMAVLYGTFANQGTTTSLNPIVMIRNYKGDVLYQNPCADDSVSKPCDGKTTLDPRIAYQITSILDDNYARSPAFGLNSVLTIPKQEVAVKTGTTNSLRDNWTIGYTDNRLVATWVGNNDNSPMSYVASGITGASPIWNTIMRSLLEENTLHVFATPSGMVKKRICETTGTLACKACSKQRDEYFIPGTEPKYACKDDSLVQPSPTPKAF